MEAEPATPGQNRIEPDRKDWTWTLTRRCEQCGLAAAEIEPDQMAERVMVAAVEWVQILTSSPAVTSRPEPHVWSPLEYGAHVRDVIRVFTARLALMLVEDDPVFDDWDQDEAAVADAYAEQDPDVVAQELSAAADDLAQRVQALEPSQLERRGRRSDGSEFTVNTLLQYFLHDVVHHLWDVTGQQDGTASLERA
jgi:hypothetical protein